jgi:hypothetical protein
MEELLSTKSAMPIENMECPLCLGKGELTRAEILDRLGVKDFARIATLAAAQKSRWAKVRAGQKKAA